MRVGKDWKEEHRWRRKRRWFYRATKRGTRKRVSEKEAILSDLQKYTLNRVCSGPVSWKLELQTERERKKRKR